MALPLSVSDILKLLEQIPIWKNVRTLPERLAQLEDRVSALEAAAAEPARAPGQPCPSCGAYGLRRTKAVMSRGPFAAMGAKDEIWTCSECGQTDERRGVMG